MPRFVTDYSQVRLLSNYVWNIAQMMFFSYPCSTEMTALPNFFCSAGMVGGQFSTPTTWSVNCYKLVFVKENLVNIYIYDITASLLLVTDIKILNF